MQNYITWASVVFASLTALSTLAGAWLVQHFQLKTKKIELEAQAKLKARELLFNSYQQALQKKRETFSETSKSVGQFIGQLLAANNEEEKQEIFDLFNKFLTDTTNFVTEATNELEDKLNQAGILQKRKKQVDFIRDISKQTATITIDNLESVLFQVWRVSDIITSLELELLEKKCEDLFGEYIPQ